MMTEREKMLAGELYLPADPELQALLKRARRLTRQFNESTEEEAEQRVALLAELFGALGAGAHVEPPFRCDFGCHIFAGANLYMNFGCVVLDCAHVRLGDNVMCGPNVHIYAATHPTNPAIRPLGRELAFPVTIGNNVWIGGGAIICPGVTIGDNTTIGAGSVVVKDIPAGVVAAGNPCVVKREA